MSLAHQFFTALGIKSHDSAAIKQLASETGISVDRLRYYDANGVLPSGADLEKTCSVRNITPLKLMLLMGCLDRKITAAIQKHASAIYEIVKDDIQPFPVSEQISSLMLQTEYGQLYQGDCLELTRGMDSESVDLVFADPPFNLNKEYPSEIDDGLKSSEYLDWCEAWVKECIRILKPGGSLLLWNLPKWNTYLSGLLNSYLTFRHWIAVDIKYTFPIAGRLYPSHYSLLYYCKGYKPKTFHPDRLPLEICSGCYQELHDYGGYKHKMNPKGVNLTDVWYDISPVRHQRYKQREGANELSVKIMDRILEMASDEGDTVFDPFGGAGTTYVVAEIKRRNWIGIEIGPIDEILKRFDNLNAEREYLKRIREDYNCLFTARTLKTRVEKGLWTPESVRKRRVQAKKQNEKISTVQAELDL
jgi:site-specific DNA-methyltransferase (adenine-specific)